MVGPRGDLSMSEWGQVDDLVVRSVMTVTVLCAHPFGLGVEREWLVCGLASGVQPWRAVMTRHASHLREEQA